MTATAIDGAAYTWGDAPEPAGARLANYWHGDFPCWGRHMIDTGMSHVGFRCVRHASAS